MRPPYLPRLDGLRAISIFLVLGEHFYAHFYAFGSYGVTLFFVISGYLITSILVSYAESLPAKEAARQFYLRRALRLAPIYYLCLFAVTFFDINPVRAPWWIDALYLSNFYAAFTHSWNGSSHFWTLSVEEQFYVLWFFVVVFLPARRLFVAIALSLMVPILFRAGADVAGGGPFFHLLLPGTMDSLATGALIWYCTRYHENAGWWRNFVAHRNAVVASSLAALIVAHYFGVYPNVLMNVLAFSLVTIGIETTPSRLWGWLGAKTVRHFGKISYGIYVYHYFVPSIVERRVNFGNVLIDPEMRIVRFLVLAAVSVGVAEVSWWLIERPVLKVKDRIGTGVVRAAVLPREA